MDPDSAFSWDVLLLVLAGPLGVLAALVLAALAAVLFNRLWRRVAPRSLADSEPVDDAGIEAEAALKVVEGDSRPLAGEIKVVAKAQVVPDQPKVVELALSLAVPEPQILEAIADETVETAELVAAILVDLEESDDKDLAVEVSQAEADKGGQADDEQADWDEDDLAAYSPFTIPRGALVAGLLLLILLVGAYFRFTGLNWDNDQHLHPDERFITMVSDQIRPVGSLSEYFDTEHSSLNPFPTGSYTYGMLPLFFTRYVAEWVNMAGYDQVAILGRFLSGVFDLAAVAMLYLLGAKLYSRRVGLLAAALSAAAVLAIQFSHFYAVDSFSTIFIVTAIYVAVFAMERGGWRRYALFGLLAGMAMACKISTAPVFGLIVVVCVVRVAAVWKSPAERIPVSRQTLFGLGLAALMMALAFRVFQPYAFAGPSFFDWNLNPRWVEIMQEVQSQVTGRAEWPPNHHWTSRPMLTYAWTNLVVWGVGIPLGLAATVGWIWAAWRCWRGKSEWKSHLLVVLWVGGYFAWQNLQFWRYLRYFVPIYPLAILLAAWALVKAIEWAQAERGSFGRLFKKDWSALPGVLSIAAVGLVLLGAFAYAFAFTRIYNRPHTRVQASRWMLGHIPGPLNVMVETADGSRQFPLSVPPGRLFELGDVYTGSFVPDVPGRLEAITTMHVDGQGQVRVELTHGGPASEPIIAAHWTLGDGQPLEIAIPLELAAGEEYFVTLEVLSGGPLALEGARLAEETSWDDVLPLRVDDYDPLGGIYQLLSLELFEPDNETKRERMLEVLERADYIVVSSNRAYDAMPRLPLRYPLTLEYYQALFDCSEQTIAKCAYPAQPPLRGSLGFELVAVFESYPSLGPLAISDQTAEEAFTVYDHPKVLIFEKSPDFALAAVEHILGQVDLSQVIEQGPVQYTHTPTGLRLPADRWQAQEQGGTWAEIFNSSSPINTSQPVGVLAWYALLLVMGWLAFPLVFISFPGLSDKGYTLARLVGLLLIAWLAWIAASLKLLPFTQAVLWLALGLLAAVSLMIVRRRGREIKLYLRAYRKHILLVEALFLALFLFALVLRCYNPDLWHPWMGGEKPMDMSYFNAVLKSTYFPPYDPWLSGGYLNYYYYGYVLAAVLTKMVGVIPSFAYNLALPTWFALVGMGAFGVAYNLFAGLKKGTRNRQRAYWAGIVALVLIVMLGNLFQVRLVWERLLQLAPSSPLNASLIEQVGDLFGGLDQLLTGDAVLVGERDSAWYFSASRAILHGEPQAPITEFPYFSFLYADLHPHTLDLPVMLAALAWCLSVVLATGRVGGFAWLVGGLIFGATYPIHTWDFPTMMGLGVLATCFGVWLWRGRLSRSTLAQMLVRSVLLVGIAAALYAPFRQWFGSDYVALELWRGRRTPLGDYLTVHGLFLFILITYLVTLSRAGVKTQLHGLLYTRLGVLVPALKRAAGWIVPGIVVTVVGWLWLWRHDYQVLLLAIPLAIWIGGLFLRRPQPAGQRLLLAAIGTGVGLTLIVDVIVLKGDVGRNNTVFKYYIQTWMLFSVASGVAWACLLPELQCWSRRWRRLWSAALGILVLGSALYPVLATPARASDRWPGMINPPRELDGMAYMLGDGPERPTIYRDEDRPLNLTEDHAAIRWMQENVSGTPVIVEGQTVEYRWGSRFAVYTGLPTVVGWSWHLRQHNSVVPGRLVEDRIDQVRAFYDTTDPAEAADFLQRYGVEYIIVGGLERIYYAQEGLVKFPEMVNSGLLELVYSTMAEQPEEGVVIYRVNRRG